LVKYTALGQPSQHYQHCRQSQNCHCEKYFRVGRHQCQKIDHLALPPDPNFHARRLPDRAWRRSRRSDGIEAVIQLHRLREVQALVGFTRFDAETPDIHGEYETDVEHGPSCV
jgi:hypothetical protein